MADLLGEPHVTEAMFSSILEMTNKGVWICELDGRTIFANRRLAEMLGYMPEEMLGRPVSEFIGDGHIGTAPFGEHRLGEREFECRRKDGSRFWAVLRINALPGGDDGPDRLCGMVSDISGRKALERELSRQNLHDPLTGLANRLLLGDRLEQAIHRGIRHGTVSTVLYLDLDDFQIVNDTYGNPTGDAVLVAVATRLRDAVRASDTVARVGGDEFVIVSETLGDERSICELGERLCADFDEPIEVAGQTIPVGVSIGIVLGHDGDAADVLLRDADLAMHAAKAEGGRRVCLFDDELRVRVDRHRTMQADLSRAIERGELNVVYQPVVSLEDGKTTGAEALVRWHHPRQGLLEPTTFIPLAEAAGLVAVIDQWVMKQACEQVGLWDAAGLGRLTMAINLSAQHLGDPHLFDQILHELRAAAIDPRRFVFEITETAVVSDLDAAATSLLRLRTLGATVAIDDFGTGLSSLAQLKRLPIDLLKIDRSFVEGLGRDDQDSSIVAAVIAMAKALGLTTQAEGVERPEQLARLRALGCDLAQGYWWAPPLQPGDFTRRVLEEQSRPSGALHGLPATA